ncbi:MAG: transcriptional regulator, partial [Acidimicrobiales bacterium]
PLASVRGERPENLRYSGAAASLGEVWIAVRAAARAVLETVTIDHLARACLPAEIAHLAEHPEGRCARL